MCPGKTSAAVERPARAALLILFLSLVACQSPSAPADLVLLNATIYTLDPAQPRAEALAAHSGKITFVGGSQEAKALAGPETRILNLEGKTVTPGFSDSHAHLSGIGQREMTLNLKGVAGLAELVAVVERQIKKAAPGDWIVGRGWIEAKWDLPVFPTRGDLDSVSLNHPVWLVRADGHGAVANSAALKLAGIDAATPNPEGGEIMRDAAGEPTGMLLDRAQAMVRDLIPENSPESIRQALREGGRRMAELGWTQIGIAGNDFDEVELIRELLREGEMPIRIYDSIRGPGEDAERLLEQGASLNEFDGRFTLRGIKVMMDGALGSKGAALLEPYSDHGSRGLLMHDEAELLPLFEKALRGGIQIETHAIGDRANRFVLDLYEKAFAKVPAADPRWRIEHAQILDPADIPRFAALKVIPSMQPSHAITDLRFARSRLGDARLGGAYAWRSLIDAGAKIAGGSDAPVEKGDPVVEFYAAVVRKDLDGFSAEHWHPEQVVSRDEALRMFTQWAAYATFEEDVRGAIEVGKVADFTVFSNDLITIPDSELLKNKVFMTIVGGEVVSERR